MAFKEGHALIIGVRSHQFSPENDVPVTFNDAQAVYKLLIDPKKCGYPPEQVTFLHDATAVTQGIKDELDKLATNAKPTDTVFVYFAGHGAFGTDNNYALATHDVKFADTGDPELKVEPGTGLSQAELVAKLKRIKAERVMFIFNACHSGSLQPKALGVKPKAVGKSLPSITAFAVLGTGEGRIVISACRQNQLSNYYPSAALTFFAKALTEGLKGKATPSRGYISAFNLYTYVYETVASVAKKAGVNQDPMITVLEGVGPFPVALAAKTVQSLGPTAPETLPDNDAVRRVTKRESKKWLTKIEQQTLVRGDYVKGDKVMGNKIRQQINAGDNANIANNNGGVVFQNQNVRADQLNQAGRDIKNTIYNYLGVAAAANDPLKAMTDEVLQAIDQLAPKYRKVIRENFTEICKQIDQVRRGDHSDETSGALEIGLQRLHSDAPAAAGMFIRGLAQTTGVDSHIRQIAKEVRSQRNI